MPAKSHYKNNFFDIQRPKRKLFSIKSSQSLPHQHFSLSEKFIFGIITPFFVKWFLAFVLNSLLFPAALNEQVQNIERQ